MVTRYVAATAIVLTVSVSCGSGSAARATCSQICKDFKAGRVAQCTFIKGDCDIFCSSLDNVSVKAGCPSKMEDFFACLKQNEVCPHPCYPQEEALFSCAATYCGGAPNDGDCVSYKANE
jgi:hypothetical protein